MPDVGRIGCKRPALFGRTGHCCLDIGNQLGSGTGRLVRDARSRETVEPADGTPIVYHRTGEGPSVLIERLGPWQGRYRHGVTHLPEIQQREFAALADDLSTLDPQQWRMATLCADWDVEEVVAHLGAAATMTRLGWIGSMVAARFNGDVHNRRRLAEFRGATPSETLERFRHVEAIRPIKSSPAGLGEVIVHAEDIRRPLGLHHTPDVAGLLAVARFFATENFAVNSKTLVRGLALRATDVDFQEGAGPEVAGPLLPLVMVMAGRSAFLSDLSGAGVPELSRRLAS